MNFHLLSDGPRIPRPASGSVGILLDDSCYYGYTAEAVDVELAAKREDFTFALALLAGCSVRAISSPGGDFWVVFSPGEADAQFFVDGHRSDAIHRCLELAKAVAMKDWTRAEELHRI